MNKKNGGLRQGAGRKAVFSGEKTKPIRIPESQIPVILSFLEVYRLRKEIEPSSITVNEIFAYELEIERLKEAVSDVIDFLRTSFRKIPVITQQINALESILETRAKNLDAKTGISQWSHKYYTPAGAFWKLSGRLENQKVIFSSESPISQRNQEQNKGIHNYSLTKESIDTLVEFLLSTRPLVE